ncbi:SIR2 family NAD-dependent protein deacylase [Xylocopilactobacillus apicola]|uniref:protein acetyllysine N-acetyltransferase n=1 Tax=Xylocopilactobacillus apicola TaxID=2932184 RepID=A0AAU9D3J3_9LACO|nr:Sir2 family NAD-dependent protein deacetylase [Xylocopilactobacillus apicola]BDR58359.1 NAD-dependent protein deacylase Sir2 [Xylocopilactobacillus apicola]
MDRKQLTELITHEPTVFILGAGLSTSSGISDFKSLQNKFDTTKLLSIDAYYHNYWQQHDFIAKYLMTPGLPNEAHRWLAQLSQQENIHLISQNIDTILEHAGVISKQLLKIHGTLDRFIDENQNEIQLTEEEYKQMTPATGDLNHARPDIVFYGEQVKNFDQASLWVNQAKIVVVIGTRLNVFPVNQLVLTGSVMEKLIIINTDHLDFKSTPNLTVEQINEPIDTWLLK